ncbi:MAG: zf-HC2 domain-containing protein [Longimicrobiales bacterium]|nr:zf-HC2 domain-containing protein [Longimicrobiales bacterium]
MPDLDRRIAGLRCRDVLEVLGDYVDGDLEEETVQRVEAHLRACDHCEKFGGEYGALVAGLRQALLADEPRPGLRDRMIRRMTAVWREEEA